MTSRRLTLPFFPIAPQEYNKQYMDELVRQFSIYLEQMQNPGDARHTTMALTQLPTSKTGLATDEVWNDGGHLAIAGYKIWAPLGNSRLSVQHRTAFNVNGGTATLGVLNTRPLTEIVNTIDDCTVSGTDITLPAGDYYAIGYGSGYDCGRFRQSLYNATTSTPEILGGISYSNPTYPNQCASNFCGFFSLEEESTLQMVMTVQTTRATNGLGLDADPGDAFDTIHAEAQIWRVG